MTLKKNHRGIYRGAAKITPCRWQGVILAIIFAGVILAATL